MDVMREIPEPHGNMPNRTPNRVSNDTHGPIYMAGRDIVINNYATPDAIPGSAPAPMSYEDLHPQHVSSRPHNVRHIRRISPKAWATISLVVGVTVLVTAVMGTQSLRDAIGMVLIGAAVIIPGAWWHYCENQDKETRKRHARKTAEMEQTKALLDEHVDSLIVKGMGTLPAPEAMSRHWACITAGCVALAMIGGNMLDTEQTPPATTHPPIEAPAAP